MCVCVYESSLVCMVGVLFVYADTVYGFDGYSFLCLVGCFSMVIWTPAVLSVLYACVLYFCICTCSAQLSMIHMEGALEIHSLLLLQEQICLDNYMSSHTETELAHIMIIFEISF